MTARNRARLNYAQNRLLMYVVDARSDAPFAFENKNDRSVARALEANGLIEVSEPYPGAVEIARATDAGRAVRKTLPK